MITPQIKGAMWIIFNSLRCIIVKVTYTKLQDINRLMGYRDAQWYIKDTIAIFNTWGLQWQIVVLDADATKKLFVIIIVMPYMLKCFNI